MFFTVCKLPAFPAGRIIAAYHGVIFFKPGFFITFPENPEIVSMSQL